MKAYVDQDTCIGCGACTGVCPSVFDMGDEGTAIVIVEELAEGLVSEAEEACEMCPVAAITVE